MKVENMINSNGNSVPNQFIIKDGFQTAFQSYKSLICTYDFTTEDTLKVYTDWDYSKTTMKYFKQFINEETPFTYESAKQWRKEMKENDNIEEVL